MVIKFVPEEDDEDSISGLSRSIGKLWNAESMRDVWETNSLVTEEKSLEFFIESLYRTEVRNDHDHPKANESEDETSESRIRPRKETIRGEGVVMLRRSQDLRVRQQQKKKIYP